MRTQNSQAPARRRPAPDVEWVLMYSKGISTPKIAAVAGAAETTVRYHIAMAAKQDPTLRDTHKAALPALGSRITKPSQRNVNDLLGFYQAEGRLPVHGRTTRESALAGWLARRREQAAAGILSPACAQALDTIPGWRDYPSKRDADAARWKRRLSEVAGYLAAGNDWPRHNKTEDREERILGVWLHTQRIDYRVGKLGAAKEVKLNTVIPGWRQGRRQRGGHSRPKNQQSPVTGDQWASSTLSR